MNYWLFKTEPSTFSWNDLKASPNQTTHWEGVRNYQARNFIRNMKSGDGVLFYHSVMEPLSIFGTCRVVQEAYPDPFQFDEKSKYYDKKSSPDNLIWWVVDIQFEKNFEPPITREEIKNTPGLADMVLLQKGSRLSIQPVKPEEWKIILSLRK